MAAYCRVYDSRHLQADCHRCDQLRNPTLGNRVWATFTFFNTTVSINQSIMLFRVVQVTKSLQDPLEVGNNLVGINDNVRERGLEQTCF